MKDLDLANVLDAQMNRKQFLKNVGISVIAMTGVGAAITAFSKTPSANTAISAGSGSSTQRAALDTYGSLAYGGGRTRQQYAQD